MRFGTPVSLRGILTAKLTTDCCRACVIAFTLEARNRVNLFEMFKEKSTFSLLMEIYWFRNFLQYKKKENQFSLDVIESFDVILSLT